MMKATYKRKLFNLGESCFQGVRIHDHHGRERGSRHGAGAVTESLHVETTTRRQRERKGVQRRGRGRESANWEWRVLLERQGLLLVTYLSTRPHLLIFPKQSY